MTSTQLPSLSVSNQGDRSSHQRLYDTDFMEWLNQAAVLLEQRKFDELDIENLIEEVEELAKQVQWELKNRLSELLLDLLLWHYEPERREETDNEWDENSWARSIIYQRDDIQLLLEESPSLHDLISKSLARCYEKARHMAVSETGLDLSMFPAECPYTMEQVLDDQFWPE